MAQVASRDSVERFCFRELSQAQYATLRSIQPCILTSDPNDERRKALNKGVKWLVLLADFVMVTENPPKTITPLISYRDIYRIQESGEAADFFKKGGEKVRHIEVEYRTHKAVGGKQRGTRTPRGSPTHLALAASILSLTEHVGAVTVTPTGGRGSVSGSRSSTPVASPNPIRAHFASPEKRQSNPFSPPLVGKREGSTLRPDRSSTSLEAMDDVSVGSGSFATPLSPGTSAASSLSSSSSSLAAHAGGLTGFVGAGGRDAFDVVEQAATLHIYPLHEDSTLFELLRAAHHHALLRPLSSSLSPTTSVSSFSPSAAAPLPGSPLVRPDDEVTRLFRELWRELEAAQTLEDKFMLVDELCTACESSGNSLGIKRLFWRTPSHLALILSLLDQYLTGTSAQAHRVDELEISVLLLDLLVRMLKETEILPERLVLLDDDAPVSLRRIINSLTAKVDVMRIPEQDRETKETKALLSDLRNGTIEFLYEVMQVCMQASWEDSTSEYRTRSMTHLMSMFSHSVSFKSHFLDVLVRLFLRGLESERLGETQASIVRLFKQAMLVLQLLRSETDLSAQIRDNHGEEFRYLINPSELELRLGEHTALTSALIATVTNICATV